MSMVSAKTLEITGVRSPDLSRCREIFGKYSKFYKDNIWHEFWFEYTYWSNGKIKTMKEFSAVE